jgi:hypothetical protein
MTSQPSPFKDMRAVLEHLYHRAYRNSVNTGCAMLDEYDVFKDQDLDYSLNEIRKRIEGLKEKIVINDHDDTWNDAIDEVLRMFQ